jgi:23S rRNA (cytidine1920-2'-O)/16S rRNA (cytidine1409-2'-O)-methyltransferase
VSKKTRIDHLLVERGLVESRSIAQRLVMAGQVRAAGQVVPKPSSKVASDVQVVIDHGPQFISRGGEKLEAAFENFNLDVAGRICADVGASTGGFTDCLLQHGAAKVYTVDVGRGILHWKLRNNPRVVAMEGTNARFIKTMPEPISFVTIDVSFISLKIILPVVKSWFTADEGSKIEGIKNVGIEIVALIKPQFEAGRREVARGKGVIRNPEIHHKVLVDILTFAVDVGYSIKGLKRSPIIGPKGNVEFLGWLQAASEDSSDKAGLDTLVSQVVIL